MMFFSPVDQNQVIITTEGIWFESLMQQQRSSMVIFPFKLLTAFPMHTYPYLENCSCNITAISFGLQKILNGVRYVWDTSSQHKVYNCLSPLNYDALRLSLTYAIKNVNNVILEILVMMTVFRGISVKDLCRDWRAAFS